MTARALHKGAFLACLVGVLLVVAACGPGQQPPQSFLLSTASQVAFLTWTNNGNTLSGSYSWTTAQGVEAMSFTGQQQGQGVSLQIGQGMSGTLNGATMQEADSTGTFTWYAGTRQQYGQLQAAYRLSTKMQSEATALLNIEQAPPQNSSSGYFQAALQQARNRVNDEQNALTYIQNQQDALTRCMALEQFTANFPAAGQDSELHLPFSRPSDQSAQAVVDRSDLAQAINALSSDNQLQGQQPLPAIKGLTYPWKVDAKPTLDEARQLLSTLQAKVLAVGPQFPPLEQQAEGIQAQEAIVQRQHQCFG